MGADIKAFTGQITDIDLRQLRIFKTVVDCGGFAAAEVELNISRPAISVAISDLESRLKMVLCQRGRSGFVLTDEGRGVYDSIMQLFASMETFKFQVSSLHTTLTGDLNIGISDNLVTMKHMTISMALAELKKVGPKVDINITMAPPMDIERGVIDGQLHVGVVPSVRQLPSVEYQHLYEEDSYLYCGHTHPLFSLAPLNKTDIVAHDTVVSSYAQTPQVKAMENQFNTTAHSSDREGLAFLILTGAYIGFLPSHFADQWLKQGKLKTLLPEEFHYRTAYAAITRKGARPNRVVDTLMAQLSKS
ncbi:LysR family transcriptional regulator [Marinomonas agarivorans]|nr:LysR family transcriptional regulator [Marinomonas agarivorans]